jgi:TnpA family transposase
MGLGKMGDLSDIGYQTLIATSESFLRLETLSEANDRVSDAIAALPIFRQYDLGDARHSPKYFGLHKAVVSLALKTTTQSIIVGKLSAYARRNKTRRALWEYDHILRSLYLLDYVDSPPLRRNVQRALKRGENYHQLRRAVSYANFGKLRFKT